MEDDGVAAFHRRQGAGLVLAVFEGALFELGQLEPHVPGDTSGIFLGAMQREQQRRAGVHG